MFSYPSPQEKSAWIIRVDAFWDRFTMTERADLLIASQIDPAATQAVKRAAARRQLRVADINNDPFVRLKAGKIEGFVTSLETDGVLAAGRATVILGTPATPEEQP